MTFLLQINAPLDDLPQAIYRTFYVYTCRKAACLSDQAGNGKRTAGAGVKVFRVQLPADNPFYEVKDEEDQAVLQRFKDKQCERRAKRQESQVLSLMKHSPMRLKTRVSALRVRCFTSNLVQPQHHGKIGSSRLGLKKWMAAKVGMHLKVRIDLYDQRSGPKG